MYMKNLLLLLTCFFSLGIAATQVPGASTLKIKSPETFRALFKTNKGAFVIEAKRKWSSTGVDRLYQLIKTGFYDNSLFFRVEQNFVVQFGIADSEDLNRFWDPKKLPDDPIQQQNRKGMISYAHGKRNDRCTQLFINVVDNLKLDTVIRGGVKGYTPVAKVIKGMNIIALLNGRYGKQPGLIQDSLYKYGNRYFEKKFPGLDRIITARIIK